MPQALDAILQYLKQPGTDYGYMLTGPWGCGKTYFWKNVVVPAIESSEFCKEEDKPSIVYVSLYGIDSLDQVEDAIISQVHPLLAKARASAPKGVD